MVHITEYACFHEQGYYTPGDTGAPVYRTKAGRIGVAICYDRHFPEYMRALALNGADLVFVPQAGAVGEWPDGMYEGEMRVAAFHNGYRVALCNRVGQRGLPGLLPANRSSATPTASSWRGPLGEDHILFTDLDLAANDAIHARQLFLRHRRPELYAEWL